MPVHKFQEYAGNRIGIIESIRYCNITYPKYNGCILIFGGNEPIQGLGESGILVTTVPMPRAAKLYCTRCSVSTECGSTASAAGLSPITPCVSSCCQPPRSVSGLATLIATQKIAVGVASKTYSIAQPLKHVLSRIQSAPNFKYFHLSGSLPPTEPQDRQT